MFAAMPLFLIFDSPTQIVVVLIIAALLFGGKKIPELAKGLGEGIRNFKGSLKGDEPPPPKEEEKTQQQ